MLHRTSTLGGSPAAGAVHHTLEPAHDLLSALAIRAALGGAAGKAVSAEVRAGSRVGAAVDGHLVQRVCSAGADQGPCFL